MILGGPLDVNGDPGPGGTLNQRLDYEYSNELELKTFGYAGATESYAYDKDGLLTKSGVFTIDRTSTPLALATGLPASTSDVLDGGSLTVTPTFNEYGETDKIVYNVVGPGDVASWEVTARDDAGRITQKTEIIDAGTPENYVYVYDQLGRLDTVTKDGVLVEDYGYDAQGRRISDAAGRSYVYDEEDRLLSAGMTQYVHDADGFLVSKDDGGAVTNYEYSTRGELLKVTLPGGPVVEYVHGPGGQRLAKVVDGVVTEKYLWSGLTGLLAVLDANENVVQRFEYAGGRMPAKIVQGANSYYLTYDQVGSLRTIVDAAGTIRKRVDYDSFGNILSEQHYDASGAIETVPANYVDAPFGFAGGLHDPDTGLVRFGFRDYDPETGRWTAKDPIRFAGGDTNLYAYANSDPINNLDPLGLLAWYDRAINGAANLAAGFGDVVSLGGTYLIREWVGLNDYVNTDSGAYASGVVLGVVYWIAVGVAAVEAPSTAIQPAECPSQIPQEAYDVRDFVEKHNGAPPPNYKGNKRFDNDPPSETLPREGDYREYDIDSPEEREERRRRGERPRGTRRIIRDLNSDKWYYTPDHYKTFRPLD